MAAVIYTCGVCDHFWADVDLDYCPKCHSPSIFGDWVEVSDFNHEELEGFYDRRENDEELDD